MAKSGGFLGTGTRGFTARRRSLASAFGNAITNRSNVTLRNQDGNTFTARPAFGGNGQGFNLTRNRRSMGGFDLDTLANAGFYAE